MVKMMIVADDFTGALDTGIQFAEHAKTKVLTTVNLSRDFLEHAEMEILVIDAETRHLPGKKAYQIVYRLVKTAVEAGVRYIYKKTDSGLRGNIGFELKGALEASGKMFLPFIPALPGMNRITVEGIHYVDGVPIHKSVFGSDPIEPVRSPFVKDLFSEAKVTAVTLSRRETYQSDFTEATVGIFDAANCNDFTEIVGYLKKEDRLNIVAGCAGFAEVLSEVIGFPKRETHLPELKYPLLVLCGSLNPITRVQIERGKEEGYAHIVLSPRQLTEEHYFQTEEGKIWLLLLMEKMQKQNVVMLDSGISKPEIMEDYIDSNKMDLSEVRKRIQKAMGALLYELYSLENRIEMTVMVIGGDTIWGFIEKSQCREINMVCEVTSGTVLSGIEIHGKNTWMISKSGGFGSKDIIVDVVNRLVKQ